MYLIPESIKHGTAYLGETPVPYVVKSVDECLRESNFDFPEVKGDSYYIRKFQDGFTWEVEYLPIFGGFDIETTNVKHSHFNKKGEEVIDKRCAYAYHMQFSVFSRERGVVYMARRWEEIELLFRQFIKFYGISARVRSISWIANTSFEFQFMRHRFQLSDEPYDFFAKEKRQPLLFTISPGMEFRECLSISGGGLAQLCKDYTHTQKRKNTETGETDLDYSKERSSSTYMTEDEQLYCINDVVPLAEWGFFIAEKYMKGKDSSIPMTKTGVLRAEVKRAAKKMLKGRAGDWKKLLKRAQPELGDYMTWRKFLFRGGYVHSKATHTGIKLENIDMYDITSSYPSRMNLTKMPGEFFKMPEEHYTEEQFDAIAADQDISFYAQVTFEGLESTLGHSIESIDKCETLVNPVVDNGRIKKCDLATVWLTDYDWRIYRMFYKWKNCTIECARWAENMWLPPYLLDLLNYYYKIKADLKAKGLSGTVEYAIAKAAVNSFFGLCCQGIPLWSWGYKEDWEKVENDHDYYEEISKSVLLQAWGIWIAASARFSLLSVVYRLETEIGKDYPGGIVIYNDTDSIKLFHDDRTKAIIDEYNADIARQLKERGLTDPAFHDLGMYDFEGNAKYFKTLGAKRYLATTWDKKKNDWVTTATIAGLPKLAIKNMGEDPYSKFCSDGVELTPEESLKLTHGWCDEPTEDIIDGELMKEKSSVAIYEIPFTLKLDDDYYYMIGSYLLDKERNL